MQTCQKWAKNVILGALIDRPPALCNSQNYISSPLIPEKFWRTQNRLNFKCEGWPQQRVSVGAGFSHILQHERTILTIPIPIPRRDKIPLYWNQIINGSFQWMMMSFTGLQYTQLLNLLVQSSNLNFVCSCALETTNTGGRKEPCCARCWAQPWSPQCFILISVELYQHKASLPPRMPWRCSWCLMSELHTSGADLL